MMSPLVCFLPLLFCFVTQNEAATEEPTKSNSTRTGKFSLFSVVTFKNDECIPVGATAGTMAAMPGTCMTSTQCSDLGGTDAGNCASGFGTCCVIMVNANGGTVTQNCTYITNLGYPTAISALTADAVYNIVPCNNDICQFRLDFNDFVLNPSLATVVGTIPAGTCLDTFTANGPTVNDPPVICGNNQNQHMYIENARSTGQTTLTFHLDGTSLTTGNSMWKVRVCQIECTSPSLAPNNCVQYFTGNAGTITSYGYNTGLAQNMNYASCVRQNAGMCSINYSTATTGPPNSFDVAPTAASTALLDSNCATSAYVNIDGTLHCGDFFSTVSGNMADGVVTSKTRPFVIKTVSVMGAIGGVGTFGTGYSLNYIQQSC